MSIVAVLGLQRKRLLSLFKKNKATSAENAVSLQEIIEKWGIGGIEPFRSRIVSKNIRVLVYRKKLHKAGDEKYYLPIN